MKKEIKRKGFLRKWVYKENILYNLQSKSLKKAFTSAPILAHVGLEKPFIIEADLSDFALGSILSQQGDDEKQLREVGKLLKQQQKKVKTLQKQFQKSQSVLEKKSVKVMKLEKKVRILDGALSHLLRIRTMILDTLVQHKVGSHFWLVHSCWYYDGVFISLKLCFFFRMMSSNELSNVSFPLQLSIESWRQV